MDSICGKWPEIRVVFYYVCCRQLKRIIDCHGNVNIFIAPMHIFSLENKFDFVDFKYIPYESNVVNIFFLAKPATI